MSIEKGEIILVVAVDLNNGIGYKGDLLFKNSTDLKRFKSLSLNSYCVMGRDTFESLPKALEDRVNVILTRNENYTVDDSIEGDIVIVHDLDRIINHFKSGKQDRHMTIVGGESVYKKALPYVDKVYLTVFKDDSKKADTYFPTSYVEEHFEEVHRETHIENGLEFDFIDYVRKENVDE